MMPFDAAGLEIILQFLELNDAVERAWAEGGSMPPAACDVHDARQARDDWLGQNEFRLSVALRRLLAWSEAVAP